MPTTLWQRLRADARSQDPLWVATQAVDLLRRGSGSPALVRWLELELHGYGDQVDRMPLAAVLEVEPADPLVREVVSYRRQHGITSGATGTRQRFEHFFVEPLPQIVDLARRLRRHGASGYITLSFGPAPPGQPREGDFPPDVFERILDGFAIVLEARLQAVV